MAITSSFVYNAAKLIMLGRSPFGAEAIASLSLSTSVFAALILESHTPDQTASTTGSLRSVFAARVASGTWLSTSADISLSSPKVSNNSTTVFFDAADGAFPSVSSGQSFGGILIYKRVTSDADSWPIALIDIGSPVTANGASVNVNWDNGANRIFSLA